MNSINVVIADDHPIMRLGLRALLESEPNLKVIGEATNGLEAIELIERLSPQVAILDFTLPVMNGLEAARHIRAKFPPVWIVLLSISESEADIRAAFRIGVDAYILKKSSPQCWSLCEQYSPREGMWDLF
jgi:DNA-binding NarL/FixJ family response regulator